MSTEGKKSNGQFARGTSGNPSGRPPGSRNKVTLLVEALLEGEAEKLTRKAIELALAGDIQALRLCLDRLTPPCKDRLVHFELPPALNLDEIGLRITAILEAISEGRITPQEGEVLSRILCVQAHLLTTQDLEQRVEKLEHAPVPGVQGVQGVPSEPGISRVPGEPGVQGVQGVSSEPGEPSVPGVQGVLGEPGEPSVSGEPGVSSVPGVQPAQITYPGPDNVTILRRPSLEVVGGRGTVHGDFPPEPSGGAQLRLESGDKGPQNEPSGHTASYSIVFRTTPSLP
jgi:hypothetical protein